MSNLETEHLMAQELRLAAFRARDTLVGDTLGMVALVVLLFGGLYLPALI